MNIRKLLLFFAIALVFLGVYFGTRLIAIRTLPPFNDEFIYIRWAQEGFFDASKRLVSLTDGKQPLYIWFTSIMMNVISSPLAAGRIVSVLSGAFIMIGLGVLSYQLFHSRVIAFVAGLLYILYPQALLLDRFALYDTLLGALSVWSMIAMYILVKQPTLGTALVLAIILGAALLVKSSALFIVITLPFIIIFFQKNRNRALLAFIYYLLAVFVAYIYQSVQRLSPSFGMIMEKNTEFIYTWNQLRSTSIVSQVFQNIFVYSGWVISYFSWPFIAVIIIRYLTDLKVRRVFSFLISVFFIPFIIVIIFGKTVYPRHLFFFTLPLLITASAGIVYIWHNLRHSWMRVMLIFICFVPTIYQSTRVIIDFKSAPLPAIDRFQYIDGWPAGWGVKNIVLYLEQKSAQGPFTVLTEGLYGSMTFAAMQLYFNNYPQIRIIPIDDHIFAIPNDIDWTKPVYAILNRTQEVPQKWIVREVIKIQKGSGNYYIQLLELSKPKISSYVQ